MKRITTLLIPLIVANILLPSQEIIQNPEKPLRSNSGRILDVEEMFRITDESGEFFFSWPSGLQVAADGSIFLIDEDQFLKFTSDGKYLKNILKKGQGPGEIQSPLYFFHLQGENIFIYDPINIKIVLMDQEGKLIEEFRLKERYVQFIGLWNDNFILTKYFYPDMSLRDGRVYEIPGRIFIISKEGEIMNECAGIPWEMYLHPNISARIPILDTRFSEDGKACFISDPDEYMVSILDLEKLEFTIRFKREYPRVKVPKREKPSRSSIKIPEKIYENDIAGLYNFKGNIWVETSTDDDKKGTLFDVFNEAGQYIDSFWFKKGESLITAHGDYLFVREQDEDGKISIVKCKVLE